MLGDEMQELHSWKSTDLPFEVQVHWQYSDKTFNPSSLLKFLSEVLTLAILAVNLLIIISALQWTGLLA